MIDKLSFNGWPGCLRLFNDQIEVIVSTDIGPRILRFGYHDDLNLLYLTPEDAGKTAGDQWRIYGGHRLWHAPENIPLTYYPDNDPVKFDVDENTIRLTQAMEHTTGIIKEMEISLDNSGNGIRIHHRLINKSAQALSLSPWAITVLAPGGLAIIPQEPFGEEDDFLLPSRPIVLWQYAQMNDPRWRWGNRFILAQQDPSASTAQKIGILNKQGWAAYALGGQVFIKRFGYLPDTPYPDYNCNNELYFNGRFLEIESLAPANVLQPGECAQHTEHWSLAKANVGTNEEEIGRSIDRILKDLDHSISV